MKDHNIHVCNEKTFSGQATGYIAFSG